MNTPLEMELPRPCLLARPDPFIDESPASWIQRLSGAHQYSLSQLSRITNIHPKRADWDFNVTNDEWSFLLRLADAESNSCGEARFALNTIRRGLPMQRPLFHAGERPSYRWCSACLSNDCVPYLRWHWRLAAYTHCRVHHRRLEELCPWCKSPLSVHRALLVSGGSAIGVLDLSSCGACGMPLTTGEDMPPGVSQGDRNDDEMAALVDQIREAYWRDDDQFEFDFSWYEEAPKSRQKRPRATDHQGSVWIDLCINRAYEQLGPTFQLNGQSFVDACEAPTEPRRAFRWTDGLRRRDRLRLATALRMIRNEQRESRTPMQHVRETVSTPNPQCATTTARQKPVKAKKSKLKLQSWLFRR